MDAIRVAVVNWTSLQDDDVRRGIETLQQQLDQDLGPVWHVDATLELIPSEFGAGWPGYWGLILLDRTEQDGDRAAAVRHYGHLTSDGHPLARVFIDGLQAGEDWTHLASHELLELLVDPDGSAAVLRTSDAPPSLLYAKRICDPCASPAHAYHQRGRDVSNFVHPAWFGSAVAGATGRFDHRGVVDGPFRLAEGGSIATVQLAAPPWHVPHDPFPPGGGGHVGLLAPMKKVWPP